jgi:hypothetical protein
MTELRFENYEIPAADLGGENPLPNFRHADENVPVQLDPLIPEEDRKYLGWRTAYRVLPYRMQDDYNRIKKPRAFKAAVLENDFLRATFLPEAGGRLVSLFYKPKQRELLDRNPVFQPANLALRNAWFSGGIEWNTCHYGHYYLTCSPVFAARVLTDSGEPCLRLYEWDRMKCFPWQIDFHLPADSHFLFARVRIVNPHDSELPMYWWTNIAVPETKHTRVLAPADSCMTSRDGRAISQAAMPDLGEIELSYANSQPHARECFFQIQSEQRRWIAAVEEDGSGFVHTSTPRLRGRKVFYWGMNQGGRRWQEFLSAPGRTYLEIQAGLARTQNECVPMPARTEWAWTEAFGSIDTDAKKSHSKNWAEAWKAADDALSHALPVSQVAAIDEKLSTVTSRKAEKIVSHGSGWGALERKRLALQNEPDRIPAELAFDNLGAEQGPWLALLEKGSLPAANSESGPGHLMTQPQWQALLEKSLNNPGGTNWLSWYHLGVMKMEAHDPRGAQEAWQKSIACQPTAWAIRNLAVAEARKNAVGPAVTKPGNPEPPSPEACALLKQAWDTGPKTASLAIEYAQMLLSLKRLDELQDFARTLPDSAKRHERVRILYARAMLEAGNLAEVEKLFDYDFATIREGEVTLTDIWFGMHERRVAEKEKVPIDEALRKRVRREFPPPQRIDFRLTHEI